MSAPPFGLLWPQIEQCAQLLAGPKRDLAKENGPVRQFVQLPHCAVRFFAKSGQRLTTGNGRAVSFMPARRRGRSINRSAQYLRRMLA